MLKFSVTTKSGRHEFIYARNYAEAQKIAKKKYGLGCIVQLMSLSSNSVVANAMNAAISHNDLEMAYISSATSLVFKELGKVNTALEQHWQTTGKKLLAQAEAASMKTSAEKIKAAHQRILKNLSAAMNEFGNRANHV